MRLSAVMLAAVVFVFCTTMVVAGPSLPITKAPVTPIPSGTGPLVDPDAVQGQWFKKLSQPGLPPTPNDLQQVRSHEFYDNVIGSGGGFASHNAIEGIVTSINWPSGIPGVGPILGFTIQATVRNDVPATTPWFSGANNHGEQLNTTNQYVGTLYDTKLTAEFAVAALAPQPQPWVPPYSLLTPRIEAVNHDQLAWYCWTPGGPQQPPGDYYVPTWDFGDIPVGSSAVRTMTFNVLDGGLLPGDMRYHAIAASNNPLAPMRDVFYNRTTDLKIAEWLNTIVIDGGQPYAINYEGAFDETSGDVSVFHNVPEPSTWALLLCAAAAGLLAARRR